MIITRPTPRNLIGGSREVQISTYLEERLNDVDALGDLGKLERMERTIDNIINYQCRLIEVLADKLKLTEEEAIELARGY